jgi:hypothetical protein
MAGKPKTRLRELQAQLQAAGIDPTRPVVQAPRPAAGGVEPLGDDTPRARARAREPAPHRINPIGPTTRNTIDSRTAEDLERLAGQLAPGLTVRLERLRPTWAAGWVEDLPIDDGDLGGLLDYVSHTHGGQVYRATVLASDGSQLYTARVPVAGPPRRLGRVVNREVWEGFEAPSSTAAAPAQAPAPASSTRELVELLGALQHHNDARQDATIGAVREMVQAQQRQTADLLAAFFQQQPPQGLRAQLHELVQATEAIEEIREVLGAPERSSAPQAQPPQERSLMRGALEQLAADALRQGLANDAARARVPPVPPGFRRVQRRPVAPPAPAPSSTPRKRSPQ